jgi:hypothetical protein
MQTQGASRRPHSTVDLYADFCGELESYAVTGEATDQLEILCRKLWNCSDILPPLACSDAELPTDSTFARAAQKIGRAIQSRCTAPQDRSPQGNGQARSRNQKPSGLRMPGPSSPITSRLASS